MIEGPDYIYQCTGCGNLVARESLMSSNTFGAKTYSDGRMIAPHQPEIPDMTKCKKCGKILWLNKMKPLGSTYRNGKNIDWDNADRVEPLELNDYFLVLLSGMAKTEKDEMKIRMKIWWAYNDRYRDGKEMFTDEQQKLLWKENLLQLKPLCDPTDVYEKLTIAEIERNLGNFNASAEITKSIDSEELEWVKEILLKQCGNKNRWVVELA